MDSSNATLPLPPPEEPEKAPECVISMISSPSLILPVAFDNIVAATNTNQQSIVTTPAHETPPLPMPAIAAEHLHGKPSSESNNSMWLWKRGVQYLRRKSTSSQHEKPLSPISSSQHALEQVTSVSSTAIVLEPTGTSAVCPRSPDIIIANMETTRNASSPRPDTELSSSDGIMCRICHEGEFETGEFADRGLQQPPQPSTSSAGGVKLILGTDKDSSTPTNNRTTTSPSFIAPCLCSGTLKFVHQHCLQQWIKLSGSKSCELCNFSYIMKVSMKPLHKWERLRLSGPERRKLICSVTFHVLALVCILWSLVVLIERTSEEVQKRDFEWPFWTKLVVVTVGFAGGLAFMYVQCRVYLSLCSRWRHHNHLVTVQTVPPDQLLKASLAAKSTVVPIVPSERPAPSPGTDLGQAEANTVG